MVLNGETVIVYNGALDYGYYNSYSNVVNYTNFTDTHSYLSGSIKFSPGGMKGIYSFTESLVNSVLPGNFLTNDTIQWTGDTPKLSDGVTISSLLNKHWSLIFLATYLILLSLLIPIAGLIFACCRCCGNCGSKASPSSGKKDLCIKIILACLLIGCSIFLLFGVVGGFGSNQRLKKGVQEFPDSARKMYSDVSNYMESTYQQAELLFDTNYKQFAEEFKLIINESGQQVVQQLPMWDKATSILSLFDFVENLSTLPTEIEKLISLTNELKDLVPGVNEGMTNITTELQTTLQDCKLDQCKSLIQNADKLAIDVNFDDLPDLSSALDEVKHFDASDMQEAAQRGKKVIEDIKQTISSTLQDITTRIDDQIDNAGTTIDEQLHNVRDIIQDLTSQMNNINSTLETGYGYLDEYYPYFYYVGITLCCILLLILVCLFFGLLLGIFGQSPKEQKSNAITKGTGGSCLLSAVVLIFLFTIIIGITSFVMLVFGIASDRIVCYPLKNPQTSTLIAIIDEHLNNINGDDDNFNFQISSILSSCSQNASLYEVFNLKQKIDLDNLTSTFDIDGKINSFNETITQHLNDIIPQNFEILSDRDFQILQKLTDINPSINYSTFENVLTQSVSNQNLDTITNQLREFEQINPIFTTEIDKIISDIEYYQNNTLQPMIDKAQETLAAAESLNNRTEDISQFLADVETAQTELDGDRTVIVEAAAEYGNIVLEMVLGYLDRVIEVIKNELGQCGPLNTAFDATLITVCDKIVLPWNSFWVSLFIYMVTTVPIIILSIWLSVLYKNYKPRAGSPPESMKMVRKRSNKEKNRQGEVDQRKPVDPYNRVTANFYGENNNKGTDFYGEQPDWNRLNSNFEERMETARRADPNYWKTQF